MLVVDSSAAVHAALAADGFALLRAEELFAPPLLWSESASVLHDLAWRGAVSRTLAHDALDRFLAAPIAVRRPARLVDEAWRLADQLGWAKTYDAEYVALARLMNCRLLSVDARLRRRTAGLVSVIAPGEL